MAWPVKLGLGVGLALPGLLAAGAEASAGDKDWPVTIGERTCFSVKTTVQGTCGDGGCDSGSHNRVIDFIQLKLVPGEDCTSDRGQYVKITEGQVFVSPISGRLCFQDNRELRSLLEPAVKETLKGECSDPTLESVEDVALERRDHCWPKN